MRVKHLGQICVGPTLSDQEIKSAFPIVKRDGDMSQRIILHEILSGETRYKLIKLLNELNELCVCDMAEILGMTVSAVSHQLKLLREAKVVSTRRQGQTIYYSLKNKEIARLL